MRGFSKPETGTFVRCSGRILLECRCGERIVLLGLEEDWRSERTIFDCNCGARLTLADRVEEGARGIGELLRGSIRFPGV